jgi:hypothetical protein
MVTESSTSSARVRRKLSSHFKSPYGWNFCDLCWRSTEFVIAVEAQCWSFFKRSGRGNASPVQLSDVIRAEAQAETDRLVERFERALSGEFGPWEAGRMLYEYTDTTERRGESSVAAFRDQVERHSLLAALARRADGLGVARMPGQPEVAAKPSKFYCQEHNPRRSADARRAYQRDRLFAAEYQVEIDLLWRENVGKLLSWDIEHHARVRKEAYRRLLLTKKPTLGVAELQQKGITSQTEIARQLGISRQAVSAALKRQALKAGRAKSP